MLARSSCQTFRSALQTRTINANQAGEAASSDPGCCSQSRLSAPLPIPPGTFSYNCYKHLRGNSVFFGSAEYCSLFLLITRHSAAHPASRSRWGKVGICKTNREIWRDALFSHSVAALGCLWLNKKNLFSFSLSFFFLPLSSCFLPHEGTAWSLSPGNPKSRVSLGEGGKRAGITWPDGGIILVTKVHINYKNSYSNLGNLSFLLNQLIKQHHSFPSLRVRRV